MTKTILLSGEGVYGVIHVIGGVVRKADEGLEWMIGKQWTHLQCWNRIKSFTTL